MTLKKKIIEIMENITNSKIKIFVFSSILAN